MPELPEVETIRRGLACRIVSKRITGVQVRKPKIVRGSSRSFTASLRGKKFAAVNRHGKLLMLPLADDAKQRALLIHLKMTGQLLWKSGDALIGGGHPYPRISGELPSKYSHVIFSFEDGSQLFFNDQRQFGFMELVDETTLWQRLAKMGPDPITQKLDWEAFNTILKKRTASIKAMLLNQSFIAGIGNIYADEILFLAGVRPARRANRLTVAEKQRIFDAIPKMLRKAIKHGGTTFRNYVDSEGGKGNFTELLNVYGKGKLICPRCKIHLIKKSVVAQRGTHFCPHCQI